MNLEENNLNVCDECGSKYYSHTSEMKSLCPECSFVLYDCKNCKHEFDNGRCRKCYWDRSSSEYLNQLKDKRKAP